MSSFNPIILSGVKFNALVGEKNSSLLILYNENLSPATHKLPSA